MNDQDTHSDTPKAITLPDPATLPPGARVLANGTVMVAGRFVSGPSPEHRPITSATASMLAHRRHELARQRAAAGMVAAVVEHGRLPAAGARPAAAWGAVIQHATDVMLAAGSPRAMSDLGRFIGQSAGMLRDDHTAAAGGGDNGDSVTATITAPADVVLAVLAELQRRRSGDLG